ncbi:MAG: class I poly(R)-hydroxyalkanoic acid synthase [Rhizobiales bacterium]|nr:class I poly(R)-hydroxyalkanoic acid synthase [Hyphomicrobiales bacterium]
MANSQDADKSPYKMAEPAELASNMTKVMDALATLAQQLADQQNAAEKKPDGLQPIEQITRTLGAVGQDYMNNPERFMNAQLQLWNNHAQLWQTAWQRFLGEDVAPVVTPDPGDRRFRDADWQENQIFDFLKQSYLITAHWAQDLVEGAEDLDEHTKKKATFYVEQIANALSPTNFALTNPEVLKLTMASNGANLVEGLKNLAEDIRAGKGSLKIRQTDFDAFAVGENMAMTPGKVVYQNDLIQLIQYEPTTPKVYAKPLLIVPPWINKFYILDLNPKKSFIRWAVEQGLTVFVISWVNPDERLAAKTFADYMHEGILSATDAIEQATGEKSVNAIGYCVGGTLLASTLAYLAKHKDKRIKSATFFTTQVDFEKAGDLLVFVDEDQVEDVEEEMASTGYLEGAKMATAFNLLRSNDLIWSYVVNNYLKGKDPMPFDLLYWNGDSTRMPAATHSFYLRECYLTNNMGKGKMVLDGTKIDPTKIKVPVYNLAAREDHIAPLPSVFKLGQIFKGETKLVVAGSGHIAGVVNPPEAGKYQYWTNDEGADTLDDWLAGATEHAGSWWPDWGEWIAKQSGKKIEARKPGDGKLKVIEDAPGSYVKQRSD